MQNESIEKSDKLNLAGRICQVVVDTFNGLKIKSGKPTTRSNGVKEWTVLAGIVALIETTNTDDEPEIYPISIATGVKALPNKYREFSKGSMVHDLHAEILAIRLFNWFLLDECSKLKEDDKYHSKIIDVSKGSEGKFKLKNGVKLALFVTEPPCGDASMSYLTESLDDNKPWQEDSKSTSKYQKLNSKVPLIRGRRNFDQVGMVRTKPGRADSIITLSKSCSDKLCLRQLTGITSSITSLLFRENIYLDYLVLQEDKFNQRDIDRCFFERFTQKLDQSLKPHPIEVIGYKKDAFQFHKPTNDLTRVPSQLSILHIIPTKMTQILNNGVKNGSYIKNKPPKSNGESIICNKRLYDKVRPLIHHDSNTYIDLKNANSERQTLKQKGHKILCNWVPSDVDNFDLQ